MKKLALMGLPVWLSALLVILSVTASIIFTLGTIAHAAEFFCPSGNVTCLIAAINESNKNFQQNTIYLESGTYTLIRADNETDGPNGLPSITGRITIRGQGSSQTAIERDSTIVPVFTGPPFRIFQIAPTGALTLDSVAVRRGFAQLAGGIIFNRGNLTVVESDISEGITLPGDDGGGGIWNVGTLIVRSSRIFDNSAGEVAGGGIANQGTASIEDSFIFLNDAGDPFIGFGGGIYNAGDLNVARTNLVNNLAGLGGGLANFGRANLNRVFIWLNDAHDAEGGGIYNSAAHFFLAPAPIGELNILSSTIAENIAENEGGGIFNFSGLVKVTNSTIARNGIFQPFLSSRGGGISNKDQLEIQNSIVALNSAPTAPDCSGSPLSLGHNLIGDMSGCLIELKQTDLTGDPGLGDLVVEDPPGRGYFPLLPDSRAINAANPDACPATDQLGLPRLGNCDIGSIEFQGGRMVVSVDIRPKKDANRINPGSSKNINVAIFSVNGFDATSVDSSTVRFGATGTEATPVHVVLNDVDGDGNRDMVLRFQIQHTGIQCGDTSAFLAGRISGGPSFIGSSPLTTVQCGKQSQLATSSKK